MEFMDKQHEEAFHIFMVRGNISIGDIERVCLMYLLAAVHETRKHMDDLYDFKNNWIKSEGLKKGWQTSGTRKLTRLAFNLYNGYSDKYCTPLEVFSAYTYYPVMLKALNMRLC